MIATNGCTSIITERIDREIFVTEYIIFARCRSIRSAFLEEDRGFHGVSDPGLVLLQSLLEFRGTLGKFHQSIHFLSGYCGELIIIGWVCPVLVEGQCLLSTQNASDLIHGNL